MKLTLNCALMLTFAGAISLVNAQTSNTNRITSAPPAAAARVIVHGEDDKWWPLDELNQKALEFLWTKGTLPHGVKPPSTVNIFTRDPEKMCRFYFSQGLGQPLCTVEIGLDGEVRSFRTGTLLEGGPGRPDPAAPKNGKLPKGARIVPPDQK
jgi:hypothetical protein